MPAIQRSVFEHERARLLFEADVFWATETIGEEELSSWLSVYQFSREWYIAELWRSFSMIETSEQFELAEEVVSKMKRFLLTARRTHTSEAYAALSAPNLT
jgi:hypothetical protein